MKNYLGAFLATVLVWYLGMLNAKLRKARLEKLDNQLNNLRRGLTSQRKKTKRAKTIYETLLGKYRVKRDAKSKSKR